MTTVVKCDSEPASDLAPAPSLKARQQAMWASGDFAVIGTTHADGQAALEANLLAVLRRSNRGGAAGLVVAGEYLETVVTR